MLLRLPRSALFPYTTLFRSLEEIALEAVGVVGAGDAGCPALVAELAGVALAVAERADHRSHGWLSMSPLIPRGAVGSASALWFPFYRLRHECQQIVYTVVRDPACHYRREALVSSLV